MSWGTYDITGIPIIDNIVTLAIKVMFVILLLVIIKKAIGTYNEGQMGQLMINVVVGIGLLVLIVGVENIAEAANGAMGSVKTILGTGGSTKPGGG